MIDMSVGKNQIIHLSRFKTKILVEFISLNSLKQSAVQKYFRTLFSRDQMLASGNGSCGAKKLYVHING
jgi:hypothetical protein